MKQESGSTKEQNDKIIYQFIQGFVDTRKKEAKHLKEMHLSCRKMIETRISETSDLNRVLFKYKDDPWVKEILISNVLFRMYHHVALLDVEESKSKISFKIRCDYL